MELDKKNINYFCSRIIKNSWFNKYMVSFPNFAQDGLLKEEIVKWQNLTSPNINKCLKVIELVYSRPEILCQANIYLEKLLKKVLH